MKPCLPLIAFAAVMLLGVVGSVVTVFSQETTKPTEPLTLGTTGVMPISTYSPAVWSISLGGNYSHGDGPHLCRRCKKPLLPSGNYSSEIRIEVAGVTRFDGCVYCLADSVGPIGSGR